MNYKKLVEKYWAGETSVAEEKALKTYFNGPDVSQDLKKYASIFQYLANAKQETLTPSVDDLLAQRREGTPLKIRTKRFSYRSIAAAVLVLIFAGLGFQKLQTPSKAERIATYWASKEIKDPKEAFVKVKAALLMTSKKLNNGTEAALQQVSKVQQVRQFIKSPD